jgi:hypothetical protein
MSASAEARGGFQRIQSPTIEQFTAAAAVCYTRWDYQRLLDSSARFRAFQELNVELCVLTNAQGVMQCVGYLVPSGTEIEGEWLSWHYMFQVASRPEAPGAGAMLVRQAMKWYPAIFGMGITPDAERLYQAFRWQPHEGFWRGVHPLNFRRFMKDLGGRVADPRKRALLNALAAPANFVGSLAETICAIGPSAKPWQPTGGKGAAVGTYLKLFSSGDVRAADVGGNGRLLTPIGVGSLREHAAIWSALRRENSRLCEVLLVSEDDRAHARRRGYIPIPLQVWCWDPNGILARAMPVLRQRKLTFFDTDKVI